MSEKHRLVWMSVRRAKCSCGDDFEIDRDEAKQLSKLHAQDALLDAHATHVIARKDAGRG